MAHLEHPHDDTWIRPRRRPGDRGKIPVRRRRREVTLRRTTDELGCRNWGERLVVDLMKEIQDALATFNKFHEVPTEEQLTLEFSYEPREFSTGLNRLGMRFIKPDFGLRLRRGTPKTDSRDPEELFDFYLEATLGVNPDHLSDKLERITRAESEHDVKINLIGREQLDELADGYRSLLDFFPEEFRLLVERELGLQQDDLAA